MNYSWKLYRKRFVEATADARAKESLFVLGIDLGNHSSSIAYFDINRMTSETIDISGGYGKPSMPTAMQYVKESREWVYGEYALLNRGVSADPLFTALQDKLQKKEYLDVGGRPMSAEAVMGVFLRELIANCKNINPKAEIAGITLSVPSYVTEDNRKSLEQAVKHAGYDKSLISMDADRDCVFSYYFRNRTVKAEKVVFLDFGARELRGGVYDIIPPEGGGDIRIISVSSLFDRTLGTDGIDHHITSLLTDFYLEGVAAPRSQPEPRVAEQIEAFAYQHKDLMFQQSLADHPVRLYYNFVYPPIVKAVTGKILEDFVKPYRERFNKFLERLFSKTITEGALGKEDISTVICAGGGFEMLWARLAAQRFFEGAQMIINKNPKTILAEGAGIRAAQALAVTGGPSFNVEDRHKLKVDLGVTIQVKGQGRRQERFYPIIERNSFWWQTHNPVSFIYNGPAEKSAESDAIVLFSRNETGELKRVGEIPLEGLPKRPPGTTRLSMWLEFTAHNVLTANIRDMGFGEMFPFTDFNKHVVFTVS